MDKSGIVYTNQTSTVCVLINTRTKGEVGAVKPV